MILLFGPENDPMLGSVASGLQARGADFLPVLTHEMPKSVRLSLGQRSILSDSNGNSLDMAEVGSIYHRVGFSGFEVGDDYSDEEAEVLYSEVLSSLHGYLNTCPALVVNRPYASETNASKPEQARMLKRMGFQVPATLVTNDPDEVLAFYQRHNGNLIYKSISYVRSIVERFQREDLDRLDSLTVCPVQLQELVPGTDMRVHVVGERVFATQVVSEAADYRYDRQSELTAVELPEDWAELCVQAARKLDFELAGIDLRVTPDGEVYCFEVNPSPAFSYYEEQTGQPIGQAIADLLIENDS